MFLEKTNFNYFSIFLFLLPLVKSECPNIVTRSEWHAEMPLVKTSLNVNPPAFVIVHHSATPKCLTNSLCKKRIKQIQAYHIHDKKWDDIGYNFLIGGDGNVYEGRGWGVRGAHAVDYNAKSVGICLIGNFMNEEPSLLQLNALEKLIDCAKKERLIDANYRLIGHRQANPTACPGDNLFSIVKTWPNFDKTLSR